MKNKFRKYGHFSNKKTIAAQCSGLEVIGRKQDVVALGRPA